jgi:hypothetical protein
LPEYLGHAKRAIDLSQHDMTIFAEITDATLMTPPAIVERSRKLKAEGADVIELGCLPDSPFPHLEQAIHALRRWRHGERRFLRRLGAVARNQGRGALPAQPVGKEHRDTLFPRKPIPL